MAGLPLKLREERDEQRRIDDFNNFKDQNIRISDLRTYDGTRKETESWIDDVEQWLIANSLPKGNEPNTNCDGTPAGGNIQNEAEPGITWQALRLRRRPGDNTNAGTIRVNAVRDGYELINATLNVQDLQRMAGKIGRLNETFDAAVNDCKRSSRIIELIATRFIGEAQIAWKSLQGIDRPRTWEDHQFEGAVAPLGLKSWIRRNFLSRVDTQLKYAEFTKIKMTYHYKNIQEYNVKYNNLKRQARQENMERRNAIDHYLNSLPHSIEIRVREWMTTKETEGTEVPLEGDTNSVQANAIVIYSQLERVKGDLETKSPYKEILSEEILSEEEIEISRGGIVSAKEKGRKYECKIIKKLEESGIQVIATKEQVEGTNIGDKGIDFMIQSTNGMILGQIKDWNKKVGAEKVKEFITTVSKAPNNKGIIISSSGFTKSAYEEIKDIENIILAEEGEIIEKIQEISTIKIVQRKKSREINIEKADEMIISNELRITKPENIMIIEENQLLQLEERKTGRKIKRKKKRDNLFELYSSEEDNEILELPLKTNNRYHVKIIIKGREFIGLVDSGAAKNAIRYQLAKELGLEIKPTEKRFGTAGTPAKVKGKSENRIKVGEEERESKEMLYVIDSSGMTEIILGRTWLEDLGDHIIVDTYGTINRRDGNRIGKTIITLYNSSMKTKAENINEIQEIHKEEKQDIYEITEEECIEALTDYFTPQGLMKIAGKEIIGFMLRTIDQKFDISKGITEKTARYIRKYLVGTVKQFISTQLKEYMVDYMLNIIEKVVVPDSLIERQVDKLLTYVLKKTNLITRNIFYFAEMEKEEEIYEKIEEIFEEENELEPGYEYDIDIYEWMDPEKKEFDKENTEEYAEMFEENLEKLEELKIFECEDSIEIFNWANPWRNKNEVAPGVDTKNLTFKKRSEIETQKNWNRNNEIRFGNNQSNYRRPEFIRGTIVSQPGKSPIMTREVIGEREQNVPAYTPEPKEGEKREEYTPVDTPTETPNTTDNEGRETRRIYNKNANRNKFSKRKFSRKGKKDRIKEKGINYTNKKDSGYDTLSGYKETARINPFRSKQQGSGRAISATRPTTATVTTAGRNNTGGRITLISRLYQSGERGNSFTAIGKVGNTEIKIIFNMEREYDIISNATLAQRIGGGNHNLRTEDQALVTSGLPEELSSNRRITQKKSDDSVCIEFEYFIILCKKIFINSSTTNSNYISIGLKTIKQNGIEFNFNKNQFSIPNPEYEPNQQKPRLYASNIYERSDYGRRPLQLSELQDSDDDSDYSEEIEMLNEESDNEIEEFNSTWLMKEYNYQVRRVNFNSKEKLNIPYYGIIEGELSSERIRKARSKELLKTHYWKEEYPKKTIERITKYYKIGNKEEEEICEKYNTNNNEEFNTKIYSFTKEDLKLQEEFEEGIERQLFKEIYFMKGKTREEKKYEKYIGTFKENGIRIVLYEIEDEKYTKKKGYKPKWYKEEKEKHEEQSIWKNTIKNVDNEIIEIINQEEEMNEKIADYDYNETDEEMFMLEEISQTDEKLERMENEEKHKGRSFVIIILWDDEGTWISRRENMNKVYYGLYQYPGGGKEDGESFKEAAIRELEEETGIERNIEDLEYVTTHKWKNNGQECKTKVYLVRLFRIIGERPEVREPNNIKEWIKIDYKDLRHYKMTPTIEYDKEKIIKSLEKEI
nr:12153_t:CDS:2 [Entrophospora candida]